MYKQWLALRRLHPRPRQPFVPLAVASASIGTLGWYLSRNRVYADAPDMQAVNFNEDQHPADPLTAYVENAAGGLGFIQGNTGIARFDYMLIPNATPRWSANALSSIALYSGTSWTMFAVFEGYNGWECMEAVASRLLKDVTESLTGLVSQYVPFSAEHAEVGTGMFSVSNPDPEEPYSEAVDNAIKKAFVDLDYGIVQQPLNVALASDPPSPSAVSRALGPALTGSSALLSFYDHEIRELKIAQTGDSRAILGRKARKGRKASTYEVHLLGEEQIWQNSDEQARLRALHPGESFSSETEHSVPATRAFGLAAYKWGVGLQQRLHREFLGADPPPADVKTPPYLTAQPEITTIKVEPGDFLVLASSGLWKSLTSEEVVGLVGLWIDKEMMSVTTNLDDTSFSPTRHFGEDTSEGLSTFDPGDLPVVLGKKDETVMYTRWRAQKKFVCVDNNAAAHVARNALGGADEDLLTALMVMQPPRATKFRDDMNVTVIFFDETLEQSTGPSSNVGTNR